MSDTVGSLRGEIVESEKARLDFIKWKIILIAALAVVGLGIGTTTGGAFPAVLGFIPLVCAYVDVVCVHNDLRILAIAHFLRRSAATRGDPAADYETMCQIKRKLFSLESWALVGTTVALSLLVIVIAIAPHVCQLVLPSGASCQTPSPPGQGFSLNVAISVFLVVMSLIGLAASVGAVWLKETRISTYLPDAGLPDVWPPEAKPRPR